MFAVDSRKIMKKQFIFNTKRNFEGKVIVGKNIVENIDQHIDLSLYTNIAIVYDTTTSKLFEHKINSIIKRDNKNHISIVVEEGESSKSIDTAATTYKKMLDHHFDRKSLLIAVGGGVVGDLAGFVAATFMRGIDFVQIPTTLLAQVDSAIGGKTGINFQGLKNMIGVIHQPRLIVCDVALLASLPKRQLQTGLAEVLKYGLIEDKSIFDFLEKKGLDLSEDELRDLVIKCVVIKTKIVSRDERDSAGIREKLNFGHTLGHAIESESKGKLSHGEAIAIGMVFAAGLSHRMGLINKQIVIQIEGALSKLGLPVRYHGDKATLLEKIAHDKKNIGKEVRWVLLKSIGEAVSGQMMTREIIHQELVEILV